MLRSAAPRALLVRQALPRTSVASVSTRLLYQQAPRVAPKASGLSYKTSSAPTSHVKPLALAKYTPMTALVRHYASPAAPGTSRRAEMEEEYAKKRIEPSPDLVSATSTVQPIFHSEAQKDDDVDMMAGMRHDLKVIKETFALHEVPTQAYRLGLAGVLPYLATSTATVACAFEINTAATYGSGYLLSAPLAEAMLHALEPLQVGYGAVILSFLGAIHWGLEWAGYGGYQGYRRYAIGVLAPAVAWPTILMPVEHALITQFLAFNLLYAVDSSATHRGWTPPWYSTYRFILTFIVGASIVFSLVGRGMIVEQIGAMPTAAQRIQAVKDARKKENQPVGAAAELEEGEAAEEGSESED